MNGRRLAAVRRFLPGSLVLAIWMAFFALTAVLSIALSRRGPASLRSLLVEQLLLAVAWATMSLAIAWWHKRIRVIAPNVATVVALHIPTFVVAAVVDGLASRLALLVLQSGPPRLSFVQYLVYFADFDIVSYVAIVAVSEALLVRRALIERQRLAKRLETSLSRARLDYLEAQLQPHFLFNSLGAVSELAYDAPVTASRVLRQLVSIFRTGLARKSDEVTLGEEIVGIEPYLDIQRIRFADWLTIDYHVDDAAVDCLLPRFILQPLVENAIRHGLSGRSAAGRIDISATVEGVSLIVRVSDNGVGLEGAARSTGRGIGLTNVRDRLAIMYGDDDRLRLLNSAAGGTIAELRIPVRRRDARDLSKESETPTVSIAETDVRVLSVPKFLRRPVIAIATAWLVFGLIWTQQSFVYLVLRDRLGNTSWLTLARNDLTSATVWALLTPLVLLLANRLPIRRPHIIARTIVYLAAAGATSIAHISLLQVLTGRSGALFAPVWTMNYVVDSVIFCVIAAIGHRRLLLEWLRAREAIAAALTAEVAAAQARATKLQAIPPVLLESLDAIAETARHDAALTERQLTRLADYLRLALECTDEHGMTPERERALERAVAALHESGVPSHHLTLSA
jgi:two-component system, LytTR family, sensor kinase